MSLRSQPVVTPCPPADRYRLVEDFACPADGSLYHIPAGYLYDGASIPGFAWRVTYTPFHPDVMLAALVHDWLYLTGLVDRRRADRLFLGLLRQSGAGRLRSLARWAAVRACGWLAWRRYRAGVPHQLRRLRQMIAGREDRAKFQI